MKRIDLESARRLVLRHLGLVAQRPEAPIDLQDLESQISDDWWKEQGGTTISAGFGRGGLGVAQMVDEVLWDLLVQRVLTLSTSMGDGFVPQPGNWRYLRLTAHGAEVMREQRWSPYDPGGYLKELANKAPKLAKLCEMYIAEALTCFRGGAYLATAVMLGAASEGNVLDLLGRFHSAMVKAGMSEHTGYQDKVQKAHSFYEKYQVFLRYFGPVKGKLPGRLADDWEGQMDGVLHLIRHYRNDAGHPTGTAVERMSAFRTLVLFPDYCQRIEQVGDWLESHANELTP